MMNDLLDKIEKEVIEEFQQKLPKNESVNNFIIQMASISAKVTKHFIEKYENEKSL